MLIILLIFGLLPVAAAIAGVLAKTRNRHLLRKDKTVIAEYEAPHLLTPAELGYLVDRKFGNNELLATALGLVGKDLMYITKHEAHNPLLTARHGVKDNEIKKMDHAEMAVFSWVRHQKHGSVGWKDMAGLSTARLGFEHEVKEQLHDKGYVSRHGVLSLHDQSAAFKIASMLLASILAVSFYYFFLGAAAQSQNNLELLDVSVTFVLIMFGAALLLLPLVYYIRVLQLVYYYAADQPLTITSQFRHHWRDVAGFQLFVKSVEFSRLQADTNPHDPSMPYAVTLGLKPDMDKLADYQRR